MSNINVVRKNLGPVTAYKYAVQQGYTGTEQEFAALMASYATVAQEAESAKDDAIDAKIAAEEAQAAAEAAAEQAEGAIEVDDTLSVRGRAADAAATGRLRNSIEAISSDIGISNVSFTSVLGKFISSNNQQVSANGYARSNAIAVRKNEVVEFTATGYLNSIAMIATTNANESAFVSVAESIDSSEHTYTYTCVKDGYIVVSYNNNYPHTLTIKTVKTNNALDSRLNPIEDAMGEVNILIDAAELVFTAKDAQATVGQEGKFVNNRGSIASSGNFNMTQVINLLKGQTIIFNAKGYQSSVAVLASVSNGVYKALIVPDDSDEHSYEYLASENVSVVISTNRLIAVFYTIYATAIGTNTARIENLEEKKNDVFCFASMGIIGDSLASGASNYPKQDGTTTAGDAKKYSWGKFIEREHGIQVSLYSQGGVDTRTWQTRSECIGAFNSDDPLDCYCIGLGVNDSYLYGDEYLGTITDINVGNESQNSDTFYGNYSKIISIIKAKSERAKVFCFTIPRASTELTQAYNQAIRDVVTLYENVYLIDLEEDAFYASTEFTNYVYSAHSTAIGYKVMAGHIWKRLNDFIRSNYTEFLNVQWIIN